MMDEVRELLVARLKELGLNWRHVSEDLLGKNPAYIQQFIKRGTPQRLPEPIRIRLAKITGLTETQLGKGLTEDDDHLRSEGVAFGQRSLRPPPDDPLLMPRYGVAEGGDGSLALTGEVIDYVARPGILMGIKGAYGLYIVGESMEPAFRRGDTVLVNPTIPPRPDDDVILSQGEPGTETTALIKHMLRIQPKDWHVEQYNPKKTLTLPRTVWRFCHKVVTRYPR